MAGFRRRRKSGGVTLTSTNKGWTTSTSQGSGKRGGSGYRVTTTHTASGKTIVRKTTRAGDGWFKIEQQTLNKSPRIKKYKNGDSEGLGIGLLFLIGLWGIVELFNWLSTTLKPVTAFLGKYSISELLTVVGICVVGTWLFVKLAIRMVK